MKAIYSDAGLIRLFIESLVLYKQLNCILNIIAIENGDFHKLFLQAMVDRGLLSLR